MAKRIKFHKTPKRVVIDREGNEYIVYGRHIWEIIKVRKIR